MVLAIVAAVLCVSYIFIPERFCKLQIFFGIMFGLVALPFCFEFASRPRPGTVFPTALWITAAYMWLKTGISNRRARKNPPRRGG